MELEPKELIYAGVGITILLVWFLWLKQIIAPYLINLPSFVAMLIYNIGLFVGLLFLFSLLDSMSIKIKISSIMFLIFVGIDIIAAPYMVSHQGIINQGADMWYVSADAGWTSLYDYFLPTSWLWYATYIFTPIMLILILPIIIAEPRIIGKAFGG